jgi:hypothetical protein
MTKKSWVLGLLLVGAVNVTASTPVAMRVEMEPQRQVGEMTEVAVVVQVSPEDRIRIGSNAILRIELDGGTVSSGSPMRAVRLEDDGSARVVVEWPPGEHHLQVEIEDPSKEDTGLWVGTVRIPDLSPEGASPPVAEPEPVSASASAPAPSPASGKPEPMTPQPEPEPESESASAPVPVPAPGEPEPVTPQPEPEPVSESASAPDSPETMTPQETETEDALDAAVAAAGASTVAEAEAPAPEPEPEPLPEPESEKPELVAPDPEPVPEPEIPESVIPAPTESEVVEEKPLVEPLRADPQAQAAEPEAIAPRQRAESAPAIVPVSAELAARYEEWGRATEDTREFSVVMLRGRESAQGIGAADLRLRVGGSEVPVERLGDVETAPLLLGLAIDVMPGEIDGWSGMRGSLEPIVERAGDGRGRLFVANSAGVGAWGADMDAPGGVTMAQTSENVARLVIASLEPFEGRLGRKFLVVLTDGRAEPAKDEWQQATDAAGAAGVPILVIALWDDDFNNRNRKNLKKLADISGGSLFLVQGRAQLESAADRFGRYLDGGYSVRFKFPGGDRQNATTISLSASDKEVDVSAPKTIR